MKVFIGCGKKKNNVECEAKDMYLGDYFKTCLQYARTFTTDENIYILSAKYGVLQLNTVITPYDKTLNRATKKEYELWFEKVTEQLKELNISDNEKVVMICGKNYYKKLTNCFNEIETPLEQYKGMGYQLKFMKEELNKGE